MKLENLESRLRAYENLNDRYILPGMWAIVRVDGRNFTRLTKETMKYEAPYDARFRDAMVSAASRLMVAGTKATLAYTQSDEISLLLDLESIAFGRKERKIISIMAGEASAALTLAIGEPAVMDARLIQLPSFDLVLDYFRWRQEDALRNALNSHCYWKLRDDGMSPKQADAQLLGSSVAQKNELLFRYGVNFNDLPNWQKRGTLVYWETFLKPGRNPLSGETTQTVRRRLKIDTNIPSRQQLAPFLESCLPANRESK